MSYLLFPSLVAAEQRSHTAYAALRPGGHPVTDALWGVVPHRADGRAALHVPAFPEEAGLTMPQSDYDALLTAQERASLIPILPDGWQTSET
jgi:hypothetical protein